MGGRNKKKQETKKNKKNKMCIEIHWSAVVRTFDAIFFRVR